MKNIATMFTSISDRLRWSHQQQPPGNVVSNIGRSQLQTPRHQVQQQPAGSTQQNGAAVHNDSLDLEALLRPLNNNPASKEALSMAFNELDQQLRAIPSDKRGVALSRLARLTCCGDFNADVQEWAFAVLGKYLSSAPPRHCLEALSFLANGLAPSLPSEGRSQMIREPGNQKQAMDLITTNFPQSASDLQSKFYACILIQGLARALSVPNLNADLHEPIVTFMEFKIFGLGMNEQEKASVILSLQHAHSTGSITEPANQRLMRLLAKVAAVA